MGNWRKRGGRAPEPRSGRRRMGPAGESSLPGRRGERRRSERRGRRGGSARGCNYGCGGEKNEINKSKIKVSLNKWRGETPGEPPGAAAVVADGGRPWGRGDGGEAGHPPEKPGRGRGCGRARVRRPRRRVTGASVAKYSPGGLRAAPGTGPPRRSHPDREEGFGAGGTAVTPRCRPAHGGARAPRAIAAGPPGTPTPAAPRGVWLGAGGPAGAPRGVSRGRGCRPLGGRRLSAKPGSPPGCRRPPAEWFWGARLLLGTPRPRGPRWGPPLSPAPPSSFPHCRQTPSGSVGPPGAGVPSWQGKSREGEAEGRTRHPPTPPGRKAGSPAGN